MNWLNIFYFALIGFLFGFILAKVDLLAKRVRKVEVDEDDRIAIGQILRGAITPDRADKFIETLKSKDEK